MGYKISVITVNYNNAAGLIKTIQSVIAQDYDNVEYIIIDGGSSDESCSIIQEYADQISYYVSEQDSGIYHAMNKGVKVASGDYCNFMNSGDIYADNQVLSNLVLLMDGSDYVIGNTLFYQNDLCHVWWNFADLRLSSLLYSSLSHQASFIKRSLLLENPYDESLRIVSDWKFTLETLILKNSSYQKIEIPICIYDMCGVSNQYIELREKERVLVAYDLFSARIVDDYYKSTELQSIAWKYQKGGVYKILILIANIILKLKNFLKK